MSELYKRTALITGITGQDGSHLAELLLAKGYKVVGMERRTSSPNRSRIAHIASDITLVQGDLADQMSLARILDYYRPAEVYNLAAQSFVAASWDQPVLTAEVTGMGPLRLLEAIRQVDRGIRFYQAGSSEMFGDAPAPQSEATRFQPRSPYAFAKVMAHYATVNYRESYDLHASNGILFNHEGPRRGPEFVTRKISQAVARISLGLQDKVVLGNLDAKRDWGFAGDYVKAMWMMLQRDKPGDYVIATGQTYSIRAFLDLAFKAIGIDDWAPYVKQDPQFMRPAEVPELLGDPSKAREVLGWQPEVEFPELVRMMVESDIELESKNLP